jgi:hypothetical protein
MAFSIYSRYRCTQNRLSPKIDLHYKRGELDGFVQPKFSNSGPDMAAASEDVGEFGWLWWQSHLDALSVKAPYEWHTEEVCRSPLDRVCCVCAQPATSKCEVCAYARYCSRECQKKDWKAHKRCCFSELEIRCVCQPLSFDPLSISLPNTRSHYCRILRCKVLLSCAKAIDVVLTLRPDSVVLTERHHSIVTSYWTNSTARATDGFLGAYAGWMLCKETMQKLIDCLLEQGFLPVPGDSLLDCFLKTIQVMDEKLNMCSDILRSLFRGEGSWDANTKTMFEYLVQLHSICMQVRRVLLFHSLSKI